MFTIVVGVALIYMLILKLTGHSPESITVIGWFIILISALQIFSLGVLFSLMKDVGIIKGELRSLNEFKHHAIKRFERIDIELKEIRSDVGNIKSELKEIKLLVSKKRKK